MQTSIVPEAFTRSDYPERSLLVGLLLSAYRVIQTRDSDDLRQWADLADSIIPLLDPDLVVAKVGYGIPTWLVEKVLSALTSARAESLGQLLPTHLSDDLCQVLAPLYDPSTRPRPPIDRLLELFPANPLRAAAGPMEGQASSVHAAGITLRQTFEDDVVARDLRHRVTKCRDLAVLVGSDPVLVQVGIVWEGENGDAVGDLDAPLVRVVIPNQELVASLWQRAQNRKGPRWAPAAPGFIEGLRRGCVAAIRTLVDLGVPKQELRRFGRASVTVHGVLPQCELTEGSCGLMMAMEVLSSHASLTHPWDLICSGAISEDGSLSPLRVEHLDAKRKAVFEDGLRQELVAWYEPSDSAAAGLPGVRRPATSGVSAAAATYFGSAWVLWADRQLRSALEKMGFVPGWARPLGADAVRWGGEPLIVRPSEVDQVVASVVACQEPAISYIWGRAKSGKTWIGQMADNDLRRLGWTTRVLSSLQDRPVTGEAIRQACDLLGLRRSKERVAKEGRIVLFIDNLLWSDECDEPAVSEDLGGTGDTGVPSLLQTELQKIVDDLQVSVVPIFRWEQHTRWRLDCPSTASVSSEESRRSFLEMAVNALSPRLNDRRHMIDLLAGDQVAGGDLWLTMHMLASGSAADVDNASEGIDYPTVNEGRAAEAERILHRFVISLLKKFPTLKDDQLRALRRLAAYSLLEISWADLDSKLSSSTTDAASNLLGLRRGEAGWFFPSLMVSRALVRIERKGGDYVLSSASVGRAAVDLLLPADEDIPLSLPDLLWRIRLHDDSILYEVARQRAKQIEAWCESALAAEDIASVILALAPYILDVESPSRLSEMLSHLVSTTIVRLRDEGGPRNPFPERHLTRCVTAISRWQEFAFPSAPDGTRRPSGAGDLWDEFIQVLADGIGDTLRAEKTFGHRVRFVVNLLRTAGSAEPRLRAAVAGCVSNLATCPETASDYWAMLRLIELLPSIKDTRDADITGFREFVSDVAKLDRMDIEIYCCQVALRERLGIEGRTYAEIARDITKSLKNRNRPLSLERVRAAFGVLAKAAPHKTVGVLNELWKRGEGPAIAVLRSLCRTSAPARVGAFLKTLFSIHASMASSLLYEEAGRANPALVRAMVERIRKTTDSKGAGLLLRDAGQIDIAFGDPNEGFAAAVANGLGLAWFVDLLEGFEQRFAIIQHLVDGLVHCHAPFVEYLIDRLIDRLVPVLNRSRRPAAVRLALLLVEHADRFPGVVEKLRSQLKGAVVASLMRRGGDVVTFSLSHELAALYPDEVRAFGEQPPREVMSLVKRLSDEWRPEVKAQAFRAIQTTMRRARGDAAARDTLQHETGGWATALHRASSAGALSQAIRIIHRIDPEECENALKLSWRTLASWFRRSVEDPQIAVDLLSAVEVGRPGMAKRLFDDKDLSHERRQRLEDELAHTQRPRVVASCFRRLAVLNIVPELYRQEQVLNVWCAAAHRLTSPGTLVGLLRMFGTWGWRLGREFGNAIAWDRVMKRVERGLLMDLRAAADLAGVCYALSMDDQAQALADIVPPDQFVTRRVGVADLAQVISVFTVVAPHAARRVVERCGGWFSDSIDAATPLDDIGFWRDASRLARVASDVHRPIAIFRDPQSWSFNRPPEVTLGAIAWLVPNDWTLAQIDLLKDKQEGAVAHGLLGRCARMQLGFLDRHKSIDEVEVRDAHPEAIRAFIVLGGAREGAVLQAIERLRESARWRVDPWLRWIGDGRTDASPGSAY